MSQHKILPKRKSVVKIVLVHFMHNADLHLLVADVGQVAAIGRLGGVLRVDVEVLQHDGLAEGGLIVDPGAALTVAAGANLEVEGAVDLVLLGAEDGGEVLRHDVAQSIVLLAFGLPRENVSMIQNSMFTLRWQLL